MILVKLVFSLSNFRRACQTIFGLINPVLKSKNPPSMMSLKNDQCEYHDYSWLRVNSRMLHRRVRPQARAGSLLDGEMEADGEGCGYEGPSRGTLVECMLRVVVGAPEKKRSVHIHDAPNPIDTRTPSGTHTMLAGYRVTQLALQHGIHDIVMVFRRELSSDRSYYAGKSRAQTSPSSRSVRSNL